MSERRARLLGDVCVARAAGLEIGALHAPLVTRAEGQIRYVDYAPASELRAKFQYAGVDPANIVETDIVWGEQPLQDCLDEPVDYIVASHVIEHVPDLIGWLQELHAVLRPGGTVGLAIPDRDCTFDARRHVSSPGDMVEAYLLRARRPSLRHVFDAAAMSRNTEVPDTWRPGDSTLGLPAEMLGRLVPALELVSGLVARPTYIDAHVWIFTPVAFLDMAEILAAMGLFAFEIVAFFPTEPGSIEFQVRLRSVADSADPVVGDSIRSHRRLLAAEAPVPGAAPCRAAALEAENAALHHSLAEIRRSTSWRLTAPLRTAANWVHRRRYG